MMDHTPHNTPRTVVLALSALLAAAAQAGTPAVFSTGLDAAGHTLAIGAPDPHYTVSGGGFVDAAPLAVDDAEGFPGYWLAPSASSKWITPVVSWGYAGSVDATTFTYTTTFDLTGFDPGNGTLLGSVAADNAVSQVRINGTAIGFSSSGYGSFSSFSIGSGFVAGLNTLAIDVDNWGGPSGLRAELSASFAAAPVPEPGAAALMLAGLAGVAGVARRRRHRA